ncbi:hypothetical protein [Nocardia brasiliensis]|uniref:hypothetical protein n=1 Tax=Nocardia brasiliensis TaxID=37326 RepID=UPI003D91C5E7
MLVLAAGFVALIVIAAGGILGARLLNEDTMVAPPSSSVLTRPSTPGENPQGFGPPSADLLGRPVAHPNSPAGQALSQQTVTRPDFRCDLPPACPLPDPPSGVMWQAVGPFVLPFSTSDGPARIEGPARASGYLRSPQGAALAAWQIAWRASMSRANYSTVMADQIVGTPADFESLRPKKDWDYSGAAPVLLRPSAFRITAYDGEHAVLQYALPDKSPSTWYTVQFETVWSGGDWKLRAPAAGSGAHTTVISLQGWVPW